MAKKDHVQLDLRDSKDLRTDMIAEGTRWLLELELLDNGHIKNALIANVYKISTHIRDVEILIDQVDRKMLIYLELSAFGKLFQRKKLSSMVLDMLQEVLPAYQFRVIFDKVLFVRALVGLEKSLTRKRPAPAKASTESIPAIPKAEKAPEAPAEPVPAEKPEENGGKS